MSEPEASSVSPSTMTAGSLLRQARTAQGLHIAALAASIKVPQRKLEALENDRLNELPDPAFTRALAQKVCRVLKIDAEPILSLLPQLPVQRLERASRGLDQPFRDRPGRYEPTDMSLFKRPAVWGPILIVLAALALLFLPKGQWSSTPGAAATAVSAVSSVASAVGLSMTAPSQAGQSIAETVHSAPPSSGASAPDGSTVVAGALVIRVDAESWVEVVDGNAQPLLVRSLQAGEVVGLDGPLPLRVKIGNAASTQLTFRGEPFDLAPVTRDNIARLELK